MERLMYYRRLATTATALVASLALAGSAHAATTLLPADIDALPRGAAVESGQVIVKLSGGASGKLKAAGASLKGAGEVSVKGSSVSLLADPEAEAWIDPTTMRGSIGIDGSLSIKGKSGTAKLTAIMVSPGLERKVTAKLGKKVITLGTLTGGKTAFSKQADGALTGAKLSIGSPGAKAINKVTGGGLSAGAFGTVTITVTTRELPLASGVAKVTIDPAVVQLLNQNGYTVSAVAPATMDGASTVNIPLVAGAFDPADLTGRLKLDGTVHLQNAAGDKKIDLFAWRAVITPTQKDVYAQINSSVGAVLGTVDVSTVTAGLDGKTFTATGGKIAFSKIAASTLKQSFGVTVSVGQPLATVDLTGTISGTF
jgi:hypothetical protein